MTTLLEQIERGDWRGEPGEIRVVPLGRAATVDDLWRTDLKAEIVGGELVVIGPSGCLPTQAGGNVALRLSEHARRAGGGIALGGRVAFLVDLPHRLSLCPDASWYTGPARDGDFPRVAPTFAVEVRDAGIMVPPLKPDVRRSVPTTSPRGRSWCGTWTCSARRWCASSAPPHPRSRRCTGAGRRPRRSRRCRGGGCRWTSCSRSPAARRRRGQTV